MTLTEDEQRYFAELAAQMVATLGPNALDAFKADPSGTIQRAHEQRRAFSFEMLDGCNERAKLARESLALSIYNTLRGAP